MPTRRTVVAVCASLAVALVAGTTVAVLTRDRPPGVSRLTALDKPPAPSGTATPSPSESPTPGATPSPSATAAGRTSAPPAKPAATSGAPARTVGDFGPRPPGSVTMPYRAGQTSWDVTANGIRLVISMTPATVGQQMTWTVRASSAEADCCALHLLYGDGYGSSRGTGMPCGEPDPTMTSPHTYNAAGRREFMLQAETKKCSGSSAVVYGTFDVAPGQPTAQGPERPVVKFDTSIPVKGHEGDPHYITLWGNGADEDGWITKLHVSFGDGTSKTFPGVEECVRTRDGWPAPSEANLPYDPPHYHHYPKPGTYTLTMTAYSAGCDGRQVQTGTKSFTYTVPEPEPEPEPTETASPTG